MNLAYILQIAPLIVKCQNSDINTISIVHTTDIHSRYEEINSLGFTCDESDKKEGNCFGGLARMKTFLDKVRSEKEILLMDAGDQFQGTMFYNYFKGNKTWESMNLLKYDLMTIGNHEFNDGPDNLARVIEHFKFPVVSANINTTNNPRLHKLIKPYHIIKKYNLAVIGYITPATREISYPGPTLSFSDPIKAVQDTIDHLQSKGIKKIIALSHYGYKDDLNLASKTKGLSLIIGGHTHTYLSNDKSDKSAEGPYPTKVTNLESKVTNVVQAYCWGIYMGMMDIIFGDDGYIEEISGELIKMDDEIAKDVKTEKKVQKWIKKFEEYNQTIIGTLTDDLTIDNCELGECTMGNFALDAWLFQAQHDLKKTRELSEIPKIAFMNSQGIHRGLKKGNFTVGDLFAVFPYQDLIVELEMTGQEIIDMLEAVLAGFNPINNKPVTSFIQFSGLKIKFDMNLEAGKRLIYVKIQEDPGDEDFVPIKKNTIYKTLTKKWVFNGGTNILPQNMSRTYNYLDRMDEYIKCYCERVKIIEPYLDERIIRLN